MGNVEVRLKTLSAISSLLMAHGFQSQVGAAPRTKAKLSCREPGPPRVSGCASTCNDLPEGALQVLHGVLTWGRGGRE